LKGFPNIRTCEAGGFRRQKDLERSVGLFHRPTELLPQADEEVDLEKDKRVGIPAVGISHGGQVETATGVRVGEQQNLVYAAGLPGGLKLSLCFVQGHVQ